MSKPTPSARTVTVVVAIAVVLAIGTWIVVDRLNRGPRDTGDIPAALLEEEPTGTGPLVAVLGDSITDSARAELHATLDHNATIVGAVPAEGFDGGPATTVEVGDGDGLLLRQSRTYADLDPAVAVIALGTNDAWNPDLSIDESLDRLDEMVDILDGACLVTVTVVTDVPAQPNYSSEEAKAINARLTEVADEVVRWDHAAAREQGLLVEDGIHLTPRGRQRWADLVARAVGRCDDAS